MILQAVDPDCIATCAKTLREGGLLGLPTETVYGLAADADNATAVAQIFAAKGRPADHPLIVHVAAFDGGMSGVAHYCTRVPAFAQQLMSAFWPGPLTLILPRRPNVGAAAAGGQDSIGIRCPAHPAAQAVLGKLRKPDAGQPEVWGLAAPSANLFGKVSPTTATHVQSEMGAELLILDGGPCEVGIESTIIDCTRGAPVLLRPGAISGLQVEQACGQKLLSNEELLTHILRAPRASGTLDSHYAPNARVRLMDAKALKTAIDLLADALPIKGASPTIGVYAQQVSARWPQQLLTRTMPGSAALVAHELFAVLREFDSAGVKLIWVEVPPNGVDWDGVRDRLQRAAA